MKTFHDDYSFTTNDFSPVEESFPDRIAEAFSGKTILITGGTGFLGKVLVEKLLRKCPNMKQLILLVRPKKGKEPQQRLEEMFNNPVFGTLLSIVDLKELLKKVTTVTGDTSHPGLGMSATDRQVCQTANIIVHSAASVRFDEGLKRAVLLNTRGTLFMLDLAKECPKLELFIHISTAYCHPDTPVLEERPYPPPAAPRNIIDVVEKIDDATVDVLTAKLLGEYPNTYAYSKALAESLVEDAMETIPAMILRPSVVIPIYKEPLPGWTDNINGPMGLLIGAGKGVIRTMYGDESGHADFIPVDCAVNVLMMAVWDYLENGTRHRVINLTTSDELRVSWKELLDIGRDLVANKIPLDNVAWFPGGSMTTHRWLHRIRLILFHLLPAVFVDALLFCLGIKPVLLRVHRRINKGMEVFEYYTNNQWVFRSDIVQKVRAKLNPSEKEAYKMDTEGLDIYQYFEDGLMAARRYILKEKDENIPRARIHMKIMKYVDKLVKILFYGSLVYWCFNKFAPYFIDIEGVYSMFSYSIVLKWEAWKPKI